MNENRTMRQPNAELDLGVPLHDYQRFTKDFIKSHPRCGVFLDMGLGKTLTTLAALYELKMANGLRNHILIIAPLEIAKSTWIEEINKWKFPFNVVSLVLNEHGKKLTKRKRDKLIADIPNQHMNTIYLINREMITYLVNNPPKDANGNSVWPFQTIIIDEFQSFKSYSAERFKSLAYMSHLPVKDSSGRIIRYLSAYDRLIGLTGTPTPNGLMDLWAEIYLLDGGARLGATITEYRRRYFSEYTMPNNHRIYNLLPGSSDAIHNQISDIVVSIKNPNLQLPPLTFNDFSVHMTDDATAKYQQLKTKMVLDLDDGNQITADNAAILQAKLSQMASGALYKEKGSHEYELIHEGKLNALEYIVNNTGSPVLVAYHFQSDKDMILKRFPQAVVYSSEIKDDWNAGKIPIMIMQPASCGFGLNLQQGGHTLVWYTIPSSLEEYKQTNARIYRQGQSQPTVIHHLLTDKTIDSHLLKRIQNKDMSEQSLLDAVSAALDD